MLRRILGILQDDDKLRKTTIALRSGLNYYSCSRYLGLLVSLGWLENKFGLWNITSTGHSILSKLSDLEETKKSQVRSQLRDDMFDIDKIEYYYRSDLKSKRVAAYMKETKYHPEYIHKIISADD